MERNMKGGGILGDTQGAPEWLSRLSVRLDFSSGHDLAVCGIEPYIALCAGSTEPA